jgi:hypothetical protein
MITTEEDISRLDVPMDVVLATMWVHVRECFCRANGKCLHAQSSWVHVFFFQKVFPESPHAPHSGKHLFPECHKHGTLGFFFALIFFEAFKHYFKLLAQIWLSFDFFYISLVFSFSYIFRHTSILNYRYMKSYNLAIQKMIFIIFGVYWGLIHQLTWNIEHLVVLTWLTTYGKNVSKLQKKKIRTKSENHETCRGVVLSHV